MAIKLRNLYFFKASGVKKLEKYRWWILLWGSFVVKHKSKYSCENAIYFNLSPTVIGENWNFYYYFNNFKIKPAALDG